jgi:hypothetical protein
MFLGNAWRAVRVDDKSVHATTAEVVRQFASPPPARTSLAPNRSSPNDNPGRFPRLVVGDGFIAGDDALAGSDAVL